MQGMQDRGEARIDDGVLVRPEGAPSLPARISWGGVFAGAVVAVAIGLMLNALGVGVAAAMVDATARETPTATTFGIGAAIWLLVSHLIALAVGGYVAARLSGNADETDATLHGMAVWATMFLLSAVLVGSMLAGAAGMATTAATNVVGGVARGAGAVIPALTGMAGMGQEEGQQAGQTGGPGAGLVERVQSMLATGGDPVTMTSEQRMAEMGQLVTRRVTEGALSVAERERLNTLVAVEYNLPPEEAAARVQQAEQQATQALQQAEEQARQAADAAATGAATAAFAVFGTMLLGALAAVLGARRGTRELVAVRSMRRPTPV